MSKEKPEEQSRPPLLIGKITLVVEYHTLNEKGTGIKHTVPVRFDYDLDEAETKVLQQVIDDGKDKVYEFLANPQQATQ